MNTGRLRETVTIQQRVDVVSDSGQAVPMWSVFCPVFAGITTPSGRNFFSQAKYNSEVTHVVEIRWLIGIKETMRVLWGTRILNIVYIAEDRIHARKMWLNCAEEKV